MTTTTKSKASEDQNINKAIEHLKSVLVNGETLDAWAVQIRLFAIFHRREIVGATSGRIIKIKRGLFGGFSMADYRWQDVKDVSLHVGIFGAGIYLKPLSPEDMAIARYTSGYLFFKGYVKTQIQNIYRLAQTQEQMWREKRRINELEELRAKSGGVNMNNTPSVQPMGTASDDVVARLQKAKQMLDNKLISDSEYESIKARVLGGI